MTLSQANSTHIRENYVEDKSIIYLFIIYLYMFILFYFTLSQANSTI